MVRVNVALKDNSYDIHIAAGLLKSDKLRSLLPSSNQYAIISNETVSTLYLEDIKNQLSNNSKIIECQVPDSEQSKSPEQYFALLDRLLENNFNRSSTIIALGGGVIGDLAGFVAATLHRGCRFVQIPTTLLAQVDSSVGGKTAINHREGKNLIGSFYQPEMVIIDPDTLKTLEARQFSAGMAEVIKYGFIDEGSFIDWLEDNCDAILKHQPEIVEKMIAHCCNIKARVVAEDEKEKGKRALLNLGHTFGHAIENVAGYGRWLHGEAVAVGMLMASKLAVENELLDSSLLYRLENLLKVFHLPTKLTPDYSASEILESMLKDKKNLKEKLQLVLPRDAGKSEIRVWNDEVAIKNLIMAFDARK